MTAIYLTIDTEYSAAFAEGPAPLSRAENFRRSIAGQVEGGEAGVFYQMDVLDRHGCKGVFFVDPLPALIWGTQAIADVVGPIVERGHDVQLHCHTEWLALAGQRNPLGSRTGRNLAEFTLPEQALILQVARDALVAAGAPPPIAFRAGNYGANDDTLRALAKIGLVYDSSHPPGIARSACAIALGPDHRRPLRRLGIVEVPIGCIDAAGRRLRHAQITALSLREMRDAIVHARDEGLPSFTFVSHSFELLSRDRRRVNPIVKRRFERLCREIERIPGVATATYAADPPRPSRGNRSAPVLPHSPVRATLRLAEQAVANTLYGT
jgi:peptidoglycan/xylan/chitin deacetylase (PgdA/CDA1 family)